MDISALLRAFCVAVEQHNGTALAELFSADGVYHDVFYGTFEGRARIAELIDDWFYRTASDFRWDMHEPVSDGKTLYARYTFSYRSLLPEAKGARAMFEGVAPNMSVSTSAPFSSRSRSISAFACLTTSAGSLSGRTSSAPTRAGQPP